MKYSKFPRVNISINAVVIFCKKGIIMRENKISVTEKIPRRIREYLKLYLKING
jgi:hypothetical protein